MNTVNFLEDYAQQKQPTLQCINLNGSTPKWRLYFNQQEIVEASETETSIQYKANFVPSKGGVPSVNGLAPEWFKFEKLLSEGGMDTEGITAVKVTYDEFVKSNKEEFVFEEI